MGLPRRSRGQFRNWTDCQRQSADGCYHRAIGFHSRGGTIGTETDGDGPGAGGLGGPHQARLGSRDHGLPAVVIFIRVPDAS